MKAPTPVRYMATEAPSTWWRRPGNSFRRCSLLGVIHHWGNAESSRGIRVGWEVQAQALQQVGGRSCQPVLAAQGLQQVCDQVEVHIKRLDLFLCVLWLSLPWETACGGGVRGATGHVRFAVILQRRQMQLRNRFRSYIQNDTYCISGCFLKVNDISRSRLSSRRLAIHISAMNLHSGWSFFQC